MEKKPILTIYRCKWIVIGAFTVLLIALSVILTTGVLNDLPTITTEHSPIVEFPSPGDTNSICSEHVTQPTLIGTFWTGKFSPNNLTFPNTQPTNRLKRILFRLEIDGDGTLDGNLPVFTINIFDSGDVTSADAMYAEAVKDTYFEESSDSFITSIFRANRYFIGENEGHQ
ncbi:17987_t:CDS:2 [Entrophospora sp. SA101]|nr:17987_t:CDS:2 [Entrophospora sp. SA101]CAJ0835089.1 7317_t:CDS:2 [Entrophospora sp. SA101]